MMRPATYAQAALLTALVLFAIRPVSAQKPGQTSHEASVTGLNSISFIENRGQFDPRVRFQVRAKGKTLWLTDDGIEFDILRSKAPPQVNDRSPLQASHSPEQTDRLVFAETFISPNGRPVIEARAPRPGTFNYFIGNDPAKWRTDVRAYSELLYHDVWPGIDFRLAASGSDLEQEFVVRPGADLGKVSVAYQGIERLQVAADGSLIVRTAFGELRESKPRAYQEVARKRTPAQGRFVLLGQSTYSFAVDSYRSEYTLVVDPTLLYSTYLGGSLYDVGQGIAADAAGNAYITGITESTDFPVTSGAFQTTCPSPGCPLSAFVTKLSALGIPIYSTYLGSTTGRDFGNGIAVDSAGEAYVTGIANEGFPTTSNAYDPFCAASAFLTTLNVAGNALLYSSCFNGGGYGQGNGVAVDASGNAYVTGVTQGGIATTPNAYQPNISPCADPRCPLPGHQAAFVSVVNPAASGVASLIYSTYLGGGNSEAGNAIAADAYGNVYVGGLTYGSQFPVTANAFQTAYKPGSCTCGGSGVCPCSNGFLAKLNPNVAGAAGLIYSSYLGGHSGTDGNFGDSVNSLAVDNSGCAYATGYTGSSDFPVTAGAFQTSPASMVFVTKMNAGGSGLVYSTFLTGQYGYGIAVDAFGNAYVAGGSNGGFSVTAGAFQSSPGGGGDAFLAELNATGSGLIYGSYLGGSQPDGAQSVAVDPVGDAYVTGATLSYDFPITPFAFQPVHRGTAQDAFVAKFPLGAPGTLSISAVVPNAAGNAGTVSPEILGAGFHAGATATLNCSGQSAIVGSNLNVGTGGRLFNVTFSLTETLPGKCDVVVTNPDTTSATLSQSFTVQQGGAPNIEASLIGVAQSHPDVSSTGAAYFLTVSNTGSVDSGALVIVPVTPPFSLTSVNPPGVTNLAGLTAGSEAMWSATLLAAGSSQVFTSTATATGLSSLSAAGPFTASDSVVPTIAQGAYACCIAQGGVLFAPSCLLYSERIRFDCPQACVNCLDGTTTCVGDIQSCQSDLTSCNLRAAALLELNCALQNCPQGSCIGSSPVQVVSPSDPNSLTGPPGVGGQRWMAGAQALTYGVSFGNEPTATAPAQQVAVTQPLGANVNLSTLSLPSITIPSGSSSVQVPVPPGSFNPAAGVNEFTSNVDLRPTQSLLVGVDAKLNPAAQTLTWTFTSIDPTTGMPPLNPLVGFLSPGTGASVSFSVTPTAGLGTGTQVAEQATVVFDANAPINTPTWVNTIDNTPPVSHVSALPSASSCPNFRVGWSGSDVGSGVQGFTIYSSDNGGPFVAWLSNTTAAAGTFTGTAGHAYSFYSIATDLTGNVEAAKTSAEASTSVTVAGTCGPPSLSAQMLNVAQSGTTVTANLQLTNTGFTAAQAVNINQVTLRSLGGTGTVTLTSPTLPLAAGSLAVGASTAVPITFNVPSTVTRFSATEGGTVQDASGNGYSFSIAQTIIP
jgi:hypothetical protein